MVVLGKHCFVFDTVHDRTCDVEPFDKTLGVARKIPIVDAALAYDCPYTHRTYLLIVRNALYVPSMTNNLLPPFILREAGLEVNDVPKIHVPNPGVTDHAMLVLDFKFSFSSLVSFPTFPHGLQHLMKFLLETLSS